MANILPTESATGNAPKILHTLPNKNDYTKVGTVKALSNKTQGGLDFQNNEGAGYWTIDDDKAGYNGVRHPAGLNNTDLASAVVFVHFSGNAWNRIDINTRDNDGWVFHLVSDSAFADVRHYRVGGNDTIVGQAVGRHILSIDATYAGHSDSGNFDAATVNQIAMTNDTQGGYSSNYCWFYPSHFCRVFKSKAGAIGIYGASPSFKDYSGSALTLAWGLREIAPKTYRVIAPFKVGNGTDTTTFTDDGSTLLVPVSDKDGGDYRFQWNDDSVPFYLDLTVNDSIVLNSTKFDWGVASDFDFDSSVGATVTLNNAIFKGIGNIVFGADVTGVADVTMATGKNATINGAAMDGSSFVGDVYLNGERDLSDITIDGDLHVNTGVDSTLNFDNVSVTGSIYNDDANHTLTLYLTNSSATAGDAGTGNGETNLINLAPVTFKVTDAKTGSAVESAHIAMLKASGKSVIDTGATDANGEYTYNHNYTGDVAFVGWVRQSDLSATDYEQKEFSGTIGSTGASINVALTPIN